MAPTSMEVIATTCFALALIHTFSVKWFMGLAKRFRPGSVRENLFHLLGEVEVVFGFWAGLFLIIMRTQNGQAGLLEYLEGLNFTEPAFVFAIMVAAGTRPVLQLAELLILGLAKLVPLKKAVAFYFVALTVGPLLGSFITEPAAMTVTALLLRDEFFVKKLSSRFMYSSLAVLFVNISIGGTLTHFAAPPVLMVAEKWGWGMSHMLGYFGWKSAGAVFINTMFVTLFNFKELMSLTRLPVSVENPKKRTPAWVMAVYAFALVVLVVNSHHMVVFMGVLLFFLGLVTVTTEYNDPLKLRQALLVAFFLGGLVVLGGYQRWWLEPLLSSLEAEVLFATATALTAITDNAALTYLGSQVPTLSDASKYGLVAGAVAGGGLTVIANAPNPAGFSILQASFGNQGISPVKLLAAAVLPTVIAVLMLCLPPGF